MIISRNYVFVCFITITVSVCKAKRGFILTAPKYLDVDSTEHLTITLSDVPDGGTMTVKLVAPTSNEVIASKSVFVHNNYNTWIQLDIPYTDYTMAILQVSGNFPDGYTVNATQKISLRQQSVVTFIQTDKPVYKPGQTVQFRILPLNTLLVPLSGPTLGDVWIEDPSGVKVIQWKSLNLSNGITQLELLLSKEPLLGTWKILSTLKNITESQTFEVKKYVLPKFEVIIKPPSYILANAEFINVEICSKYTYGKNVNGVLHAKVAYQVSPFADASKSLPSFDYEGKISGCTKLLVDANELSLGYWHFYYKKLKILAEIVENGTGISQNASVTVKISNAPLELEFFGAEKDAYYFKPGIPYRGNLQVTKPDGSSAASEDIQICAIINDRRQEVETTSLCNIFLSNKDGIIVFVVPAQSKEVYEIKLKAAAKFPVNQDSVKLEQPEAMLVLKAWYSPSDSYLQIESPTHNVACNRLEKVKIQYTIEQGLTVKFRHQVISRGRIVQLGSHTRSFDFDDALDLDSEDAAYLLRPQEVRPKYAVRTEEHRVLNRTGPQIGELTLNFDARSTMSPLARLLVFYIRDDGELVADSKVFRISHCLLNEVKFVFRHSQQYPDTVATMLLSASPMSLCGLGIVDKSVHLLSAKNTFTKDKVFKLLESFDVGKKPKLRKEKPCVKEDADLQSWEDFLQLSEFVMPKTIKYMDSVAAFNDAGVNVITDLLLDTAVCIELPIFIQNNLLSTALLDRSVHLPMSIHLKDVVDSDQGQVDTETNEVIDDREEIRSYFPETWLWEMHALGLSGETAIKRRLPHTVTDWVGEAVCVHPKFGLGISDAAVLTAFQPFFVSFNLPYSVIRGETVIVSVSVFNYLTDCLQIQVSLESSGLFDVIDERSSHEQCVCSERSETTKFGIKPLFLGSLNVTVYAFATAENYLCGNASVPGSYVDARDAVTHQLLVEPEGFPKEKVINYYFCPQKDNGTFVAEVDLLLPNNIVNDSARAYISITGDLMGPALTGLEHLVQLPTGCGEQNMVLFTPIIFILEYLIETNQIKQEIKHKAVQYLQKGYQRELTYRHSDGSYSTFGSEDSEGNTWLTAFVIKSFAKARRFISVDDGDLRLSIMWLEKEQLENGCFNKRGYLLNKAMQGGLDRSESLAPLTAYVLISLLESGLAMVKNSKIVDNAIFCLAADDNPNSYSLALFAYSMVIAGRHEMAVGHLEELEKRAVRRENMMFWEFGGSSSGGISIEIAGYYMLAMLNLKGSDACSDVLPIVYWISKQRNANGGFLSTQDTVIALQALAKYSSFTYSNSVDLTVNVESDDLIYDFELYEENKFVMQVKEVPSLPTVLDLRAVGEGCGLAQFTLRYSVLNRSLSEVFHLDVKAARRGSINCNLPVISICIRYKIPSEVSNMIVVEVNMVSGYVPDEWTLQKILGDKHIGLKRYEIEGNAINFYFDELSSEQKCFQFNVKNEVQIENQREARVKLYDYYEPEQKISTSYSIPLDCSSVPLPNEDFTEATDEYLLTSVTDYDYAELPNEEPYNEAFYPMDGFVDIAHDLDFPDGIEGNQPVSVLPPSGFNQETNPTCPICLDELPENFTETYCSSFLALRISIKNPKLKKAKILKDFSPCFSKPKLIKEFCSIVIDESCKCPPLEKRGIIFAYSNTKFFWHKSDDPQLNLSSDIYIMPMFRKSTSPTLKIRPALCRNMSLPQCSFRKD